jgi:hypothetical protein
MATIVSVVGSLLSGVAVRSVSYTEFKQKLRAGVVRLLLDREVVEGDEVRRLLDAERAPALRASA